MANNVEATAGTGTTFKTTDNAGVHTGHVNVDTLPALVAGTAAIGKLAANSGVDIGDVDILSIAAGDNNIGNVDIASIAAGDNNIGNVDIVTMPTVTVNAHAVTNAGTFAVQVDGDALTALQVIDNPVVVDDAAFTPATTSVMMAGFEFDDVAPDSVGEGDAGAARMSANRSIYVNVRDNAGNERGLNVTAGGAASVDIISGGGTAYVAQDVAIAGIPIPSAYRASTATPTAMSGDGDAVYPWATRTGATVISGDKVDDAAFTPGTDRVVVIGAHADESGPDSVDEGDAGALRMSLARGLHVNLRDSSGTELSVATAVAHDAADSGDPIKLGAKAIATFSSQTLVAANDRSNLFADLDGILVVKTGAAQGDYVSGVASNTDGASTEILAAGAAGVKHYITDVTFINAHASTFAYVEMKDGTTVKWRFPLPPASGVTHHFSTPLGGTAATAWNFDVSAAVTTVYCSVSGFKSKV